MLITLEGVPAVGKSTVAKILCEKYEYYRVPEVNELFPNRPHPEPQNWYASRQIERSEIARKYDKSVLDGDVFQVIWLSWIYPKRGFANITDSIELFRRNSEVLKLPLRTYQPPLNLLIGLTIG